MSKLSEYIALIPRGFKNTPQILMAITNQVRMELNSLPADKQEVIIGRRLLCETCPYMSKNAVNGYEIEGKKSVYKTDRDDKHCIWCGCPVETRTASLSSNCGIEEYNLDYGTNVPLKWKEEKVYFKSFLKQR